MRKEEERWGRKVRGEFCNKGKKSLTKEKTVSNSGKRCRSQEGGSGRKTRERCTKDEIIGP